MIILAVLLHSNTTTTGKIKDDFYDALGHNTFVFESWKMVYLPNRLYNGLASLVLWYVVMVAQMALCGFAK